MKSEIDKTSAKSTSQIDSAPNSETLSVEIRVHERGTVSLEASESESAVVAAPQGWLVRLMVLGAVWAIAAVYVGAHIGSG